MEAIDYNKLAEAIADKLIPTMADKHTIWSSDDCARYLRIKRRVFTEKTSKLPDFPEPVALTAAGGKSNRWRALEVIRWANRA